MTPRSVHDRTELAAELRKDPALHAYELGDLDDFFWPYTSWFRHATRWPCSITAWSCRR
jgi:hypothetical protein